MYGVGGHARKKKRERFLELPATGLEHPNQMAMLHRQECYYTAWAQQRQREVWVDAGWVSAVIRVHL